MNWREELETRGYAVIPGILSPSETKNYIQRIRRQLYKAVGEEEMESFLARTAVNGVIHGLDNLRVLWEIRTNERVRQIFKELYDEDLYLYVDRFNYRPSRHGPFQEHWHIDENPLNPQSRYQAFISLTSSKEQDDCLGILENSHRYMDEHLRLCESPFIFQKEHYDWYLEKGCVPRRVACPRGSLVIWDSRCYHTPLNSMRSEPRTRLVVYVRYFPVRNFPRGKRLQVLHTYPEFEGQLVRTNDAEKYREYIFGVKENENQS